MCVCIYLDNYTGAGEMDRWLRTLCVPPEDPGLISSTHMAAHNCLESQFQGIRHPQTENCAHEIKINK